MRTFRSEISLSQWSFISHESELEMRSRIVPYFAHEPRTEQEVVCLFGSLLPHLDIPFIIEQVRSPFPDCTVRNTQTDATIRIEFELYGRNFIRDGHDFDKCDMIVCWIDDWGQWPMGLQVLQLREVVRSKCPSIIKNINERAPGTPWNRAAFIAQCRVNGLSESETAKIEAIIEFATSHGLGQEWLTDATGSFAVRDRDQFFKVYTTGWLGFPFSRLNTGSLFPELVNRINASLGTELVTMNHAMKKGIGGDVSILFQTTKQLNAFLAVWQWFAERRA